MGTRITTVERKALQALHIRLRSDYPKAFGNADASPYHRVAPLKLGIHRDIVTAYPDVASGLVRKFINWYVYTPEYLRLSALGTTRIDLSGAAAGVVSASEAAYAQTVLSKLSERRGGLRSPREEASPCSLEP